MDSTCGSGIMVYKKKRISLTGYKVLLILGHSKRRTVPIMRNLSNRVMAPKVKPNDNSYMLVKREKIGYDEEECCS